MGFGIEVFAAVALSSLGKGERFFLAVCRPDEA